jgi:hypothetical protein
MKGSQSIKAKREPVHREKKPRVEGQASGQANGQDMYILVFMVLRLVTCTAKMQFGVGPR